MKVIILVDGGYTRKEASKARKNYDNAFIEEMALNAVQDGEYLLRILYYDAPKYRGKVTLPVSGNETNFHSNDRWLSELAQKEKFAVRRGTLGFRGWKPKNIPTGGRALVDNDFAPIFEQKGVDMRIGLDIATYSQNNIIDRIILFSADTDMVPAMKHARKAGIEVGLVKLPDPCSLSYKLVEHSDFIREVSWPKVKKEKAKAKKVR